MLGALGREKGTRTRKGAMILPRRSSTYDALKVLASRCRSQMKSVATNIMLRARYTRSFSCVSLITTARRLMKHVIDALEPSEEPY